MSPPLPGNNDHDEQQLSASLAAAAGLVLTEPVPASFDGLGSDKVGDIKYHHLQQQYEHALQQETAPIVGDVNTPQNFGVSNAIVTGLAVETTETTNTIPTTPTALEGGAVEVDAAAAAVGPSPKKRCKKLPLTNHEALMFAPRGIYVDVAETMQLRCSCNHKPCDKWDQYGYTRHFSFKCHKKYEEERLDEVEILRLRDAKSAYLTMHPPVEELSIRKQRKAREGEKLLSVDELRVQERHWMGMWKDAKNELRQLRADLKEEADEEIRGEMMADIAGLKKRKGDWARLLGLGEVTTDFTVTL
mmetsp:Transcript_30686/g.56229  ORF Transcript_30686/g.56229 Transcript_30686/m.56229 type:complete len:303 (-) Transcript_30686:123-1031(-)|eukprot:CAMPEP_0201600738 /NCGR_PEP_ID=MMETSP0492-20130828/1753_1 /ASSEMBLY_ACC=CAM_ASM_000837 /TAXON_ID=420259 /ORGANISM="Thalassiosira gravida, Strain GMp14c1" /LENGTH=302 /DNA_ID=CAMNT_0048063617 /DNA_START=55 /DNA_END=963 /DNA_ORIENTATION=+